jgi:hypothetical protein
MSISRLTAVRIASDPEVYASSFGPIEGKYGLYIGTYDEAPSGWKRPRDLMTSDPIYDTPEAAKIAGEGVIRELKQSA